MLVVYGFVGEKHDLDIWHIMNWYLRIQDDDLAFYIPYVHLYHPAIGEITNHKYDNNTTSVLYTRGSLTCMLALVTISSPRHKHTQKETHLSLNTSSLTTSHHLYRRSKSHSTQSYSQPTPPSHHPPTPTTPHPPASSSTSYSHTSPIS